jgi:hypothetical protein
VTVSGGGFARWRLVNPVPIGEIGTSRHEAIAFLPFLDTFVSRCGLHFGRMLDLMFITHPCGRCARIARTAKPLDTPPAAGG